MISAVCSHLLLDSVYVRPSYVLQVVLITDGSLGIGKGSLRHSLQTLKQRGDDKKFPLPFPFPTKMFIMCVANAEEVLNHTLFAGCSAPDF